MSMQVYLPASSSHVGTGHPPATAIQNFARQVAEIKKGKLEPVMRVGCLDTARDFIDVRDGVRRNAPNAGEGSGRRARQHMQPEGPHYSGSPRHPCGGIRRGRGC